MLETVHVQPPAPLQDQERHLIHHDGGIFLRLVYVYHKREERRERRREQRGDRREQRVESTEERGEGRTERREERAREDRERVEREWRE